MPTRCISVIVGLLLGCLNTVFAQSPPPVLYSFCSVSNCTDGAQPVAGVIQDAAGNLYGTTFKGGDPGYGTVFKLTPNADGGWTEAVLHSFCPVTNCTDGAYPAAGLIQDAAGNLYGTTQYGHSKGYNNGGTVFELTPEAGGDWKESVIYTFCTRSNCTDGAEPEAGLIQDSAGNLYGTTFTGGTGTGQGGVCDSPCGTVFKLAPKAGGGWTETVLYNFCSLSKCADGGGPVAGLIQDTAGNFYGTTYDGGANGQGTVFKLDDAGHETDLYSFCSGTNCTGGANPAAGLIRDTKGNLYGTTVFGGTVGANCNPSGCGTVFKLTPKADGGWTETDPWSFCSGSTCTDGGRPFAGLIQDAAGNLYGTTSYGGANVNFSGGGTVFKLTPKAGGGWTETLFYSFCSVTNCTDGWSPFAGLIQDAAGNLYGTTSYGGTKCTNAGCGTVFEIAGNGVDLSKYAGDVSATSWQEMTKAGRKFAVVQAWGGKTQNPYAEDQLLGAQNNGLATAAYALLNYLPNGGTGADQVDQAIAAVGQGISDLNFMMVDVEPCCGYNPWTKSLKYAVNATIGDPGNHIQKVITAGISGKKPPKWNDHGGTTMDGTVVWQDTSRKIIGKTDRIARILDAVSEIPKNLNVVIYTDRNSWTSLTGSCGTGQTNNCSSLIALPLWDVEHTTFIGSDGLKHCGDGIPGLGSFKPYSSLSWQARSGNQYDFGLLQPGADESEITASLMGDDPPKGTPCGGDSMFGTTVDLDFFDPVLFQ